MNDVERARQRTERERRQGHARSVLERIEGLSAEARERGAFQVPRFGPYGAAALERYNAYDVFEKALRDTLAGGPLSAAGRLTLHGAKMLARYSDPLHFERLVRLIAKELVRRGWV